MTRRYSTGFSMIEVLVTFMIASVGLMGLASMQLITIKNANNTQFRTLATLYAYDMAERIRSNRAAAAEYAGVDTSDGTACSGCSAGGIAKADVDEWTTALTQNPEAGGLPEGVGKISQNGGLYEITIEWDEQSRNNNGGLVAAQSYTLTIDI